MASLDAPYAALESQGRVSHAASSRDRPSERAWAELDTVTKEAAAKEAAHAAEAARLTRLKAELEEVERKVREATEQRLAAAAKEAEQVARR